MNDANETTNDDLKDRIMEHALHEMLGDESPPDLTDKITAMSAHVTEEENSPAGLVKHEGRKRTSRTRWAVWTTAAILLVGVGVLSWFGTSATRSDVNWEVARYKNVDMGMLEEREMKSRDISSPRETGSAVAPDGESGRVIVYDPARVQTGYGGHDTRSDRESLSSAQQTQSELLRAQAKLLSANSTSTNVNAGNGAVPTSGFAFVSGQAGREPEVLSGAQGAGMDMDEMMFGGESRRTRRSGVDERNFAHPRFWGDQSSQSPFPGFTSDLDIPFRQQSFRLPEGRGPANRGDQYARIIENDFLTVTDHPKSTFSIDVDTASYANVRKFLMQHHTLPPPDAVRIEELVNYFSYDYAGPESDDPFAAHLEVTTCPWDPKHRLVRVGLQGQEIEAEERPSSNLVFLIDVSGSMNQPDKLPLVKRGMQILAEHLEEKDRVAIVVYASSEGLVLPSTTGDEREKIVAALDGLSAGGSTNGGAGIELAYKIAQEHAIEGGVNRVILCTDGDFNVGTTSTGDLQRLVESKAKDGTYLTVLGFGRGNLNDQMMETVSNKGNGNYHYVDSMKEAQKVLIEQMGGTLVTIAKDVKIQIEFNPSQVGAYRLIGYENRIMATEDFDNDKKDAGEIGAGHSVTALYELVPAGQAVDAAAAGPLKYQQPTAVTAAAASGEMLTLYVRYKRPAEDRSKKLEFPLKDQGASFGQASPDTKFAAAVAAFGMLLRGSAFSGNANYDAVLEMASSAVGEDEHGYRAELVEMIGRARGVAGKE